MLRFRGVCLGVAVATGLVACDARERTFGGGSTGGVEVDGHVPSGGAPAAGGAGGSSGGGAVSSGGGSGGGAAGDSSGGAGGSSGGAEGRDAGPDACADGACVSCASGMGNCDDDPTDCETDLTSVQSCGKSCETRQTCASTNATGVTCPAGKCLFACAPNYADCDGDGTNGCEVYLGAADTCGTTCEDRVACAWPTPACRGGACVAPPSCEGLPSTCGSSGNASCCQSSVVQGGTFNRSQDVNFPATVSDFRLDDFEITVGRFRKFVDAWHAGYRVKPGEGKHAHLNEGKGLVGDGQLYEQGWNPAWDASIPATKAAWSTDLSCSTGFPTWTANDDTKAINCLSWFAAAAFCIYDGGFLPSEAEWNYAAAGGSEQRPYPWGSAPPSATLANFDCNYNPPCGGARNISPPGAYPAGNGRYGQADLGGNLVEWLADMGSLPYPLPCTDCVELELRSVRGVRSGSFSGTDPTFMRADTRVYIAPQERYDGFGGRCARRAFPPR